MDDNEKIIINDFSDLSFLLSCRYGQIEIAKWLYDLSKIDGNTKIYLNEDNYNGNTYF